MPLDDTITPGQMGHIADHETIADQLNHKVLNLRDVVTPSGTNDTAAVNAALAAFDAAGGGTVFIPKDNWVFTGATSVNLLGTANPIHLDAEPGCVWDMTGMTSGYGIELGGALSTSAALGADCAKGVQAITCALTVSPGDIIQILSTDIWAVGQPKGELARVLSSAAGVITLDATLWDGYTAATTTVTKQTSPRVSIRNLITTHNNNNSGIRIAYAQKVLLENVHSSGARYALHYIQSAFGAMVKNCSGRDSYNIATGTSYGLSIGSGQDFVEIGNHYYGGRHAVAHGGTFPTRNIQILGGTYTTHPDSGQGAVDFHPNCENIKMVGVTAIGGVHIKAPNFQAVGCTFKGSYVDYAAQVFQSRDCDYITFTGCSFETSVSATASAIGIYARTGAAAATISLLSFTNCFIKTNVAGVYVSPATSGDTGTAITRLVFDNCYGVAGGSFLVTNVSGAADIPIGDLIIHNSYLRATGAVPTLNLTSLATSRLTIKGSNIICTVFNNKGLSLSGGATDVTIEGTRFAGETNTAYQNSIASTGRLVFLNSVIDNYTSQGGMVANTCSEALVANIKHVNTAGIMYLPSRYYHVKDNWDLVTTAKATTPPSAGTWAVGDRCLNTVPAAGGTPGWVCTAAGTPGTWKAMAAVAA